MNKKVRRINGIEGLRTYAILMVIACHIGFLAPSSGGIGNKIFFTLSGFFAYYSTRNINSPGSVLRFYRKKLLRILPAYWLTLVIVWKLIPGVFILHDLSTDQSLILNMLFLRGFGHLWFAQQIMMMYLCAPAVRMLICLIHHFGDHIFSRRPFLTEFLCAVILVLTALIEKKHLTADILHLAGEGSHAQFQIWMFLFGFAAACTCEASKQILPGTPECNKILCGLTNAYLTLFFLVLTLFVVPGNRSLFPAVASFMDSELLRTVLSCGAVYLLAVSEGSFYSKILHLPPFSFISEITFEIYLFHFFLLGLFRTGPALHDFLSNVLVSTAFAYLIHTIIKTFYSVNRAVE